MTQGRKRAPEADLPAVRIDHAAVSDASQALTELGQRSAQVAELYGDGLPYDRSRIVHEARFYMSQSAEAMLEAGKCLIQLKENESRGEFMDIVTDRLGLEPRTAQLMMQAAVKYLSPGLASKANTFSLLGKSKLLNLMAESDGDLAELAAGGTIAGLKLDDMQAMSSRELRAALIEARKKLTDKDRVLAKKEAKVTELEEALERRNSAEPSEAEQAQLDAVRDAALSAEMAVRQLVVSAAAVLAAPTTEAAGLAALQAVQFVATLFGSLISEAGVPVDFEETVTPSWLRDVPKASRTSGSN